MNQEKNKTSYEKFQEEIKKLKRTDIQIIIDKLEELESLSLDTETSKTKRLTQEMVDAIKKEIQETVKESDYQHELLKRYRILQNRLDRGLTENFGKYMLYLRKKHKFTLQQVADKTGLSPSYIHKIERGEKKNPSYPVLQSFAALYDIDIETMTAFSKKEKEVISQKHLQSLQEIILLSSFSINNKLPTSEEREKLVKIIEYILNSKWEENSKHIETIEIIRLIDDFKHIQK